MITSPEEVEKLSQGKKAENEQFRKHLRQYSSAQLDGIVQVLAAEVAGQINCLDCGNCCNKLVPVVTPAEISRLATLLDTTADEFTASQLAFDEERDAYTLRSSPCCFLDGRSCTIYPDRPASCRDYPHLGHSDFKYRRSTWINYRLCPIVYNVVERLKKETAFKE